MADTDNKPTERTLDTVIERAVKFVAAIGNRNTIMTLMQSKGFDSDELTLGWGLIHKASGYYPNSKTPTAESPDTLKKREASAELDNWDEPNFRIIRLATQKRFPEVYEHLFEGELEAKEGPESIVSVKLLLDRIVSLQEGRKEVSDNQRKKDKEALTLLAKRGYTEAEWLRLCALHSVATAPVKDITAPAPPKQDPKDREQALIDLYDWYQEWSSVAHTVIKRRDYLIAMGLAKQKRPPKPPKA
jgi:hypothetical protein